MLQNTNHDIMPSAEQSAHLAGRVMVIDRKSAFVWGKSANGAAMVLSGERFGIPFRRYSVAALQFFAPLNFSPLRRPLMAINSLAAILGQTVFALIRSVFRPDGGSLFKSSHNVLLPDGLRLSSYHPIGA